MEKLFLSILMIGLSLTFSKSIYCQKPEPSVYPINEEMIIGEWKEVRYEVLDKNILSKKDLENYNNQESYKENDFRFRFEQNKRFRMFHNGRELEKENKVEFKLLDSSMIISKTGNIIDFDIYNRDGSYYNGSNRMGPFEIIKITENELFLKDLEKRYRAKRQNINLTDSLKEIIKYKENFLSVFERVNYKKDAINQDSINNVIKQQHISDSIVIANNYKNPNRFTDYRDNKTYKTVKIGSQTWMAENLAYKTNSGKNWAYNNDQSNVAKYGYLYNRETAKTACPAGWHLPSDSEWKILVDFLGGEDFAGEKMKTADSWEENGNGTNISGFNGLPGGSDAGASPYQNIGRYGIWWSSTNENNRSDISYVFGLGYNNNRIISCLYNNPDGASVRCIKDVESLKTDSIAASQKIAILSKGDIWTINGDGTNMTRLTNNGKIRVFTWDSNGKNIYYTSNNNLDLAVFSLSIEDSLSKPVLISVLLNKKGTQDFFLEESYGITIQIYAIDKTLVIPCNCTWGEACYSIYTIDLKTKKNNYYESWDNYPGNKKTYKVESNNITKTIEQNITNVKVNNTNKYELYYNGNNKKIRLTNTQNIARDEQFGTGEIDFKVSPKGNKVLFSIIESSGDLPHGPAYIVNIDGSNQTRICDDGILDSGFYYGWLKGNDNLCFINENGLQILTSDNKMKTVYKYAEFFELQP